MKTIILLLSVLMLTGCSDTPESESHDYIPAINTTIEYNQPIDYISVYRPDSPCDVPAINLKRLPRSHKTLQFLPILLK